MTDPTKRPWTVCSDREPRTFIEQKFIGVKGNEHRPDGHVALCGKPGNALAEANAIHIVKCVNHFEAVVEALEYLVAKHDESMTRPVTIDWDKAKQALARIREPQP